GRVEPRASIVGPRARAVAILVRVHEEGAWASRLLESIDESALDPRDLALLHEIVLGVLRWRGALDDALRGRLRAPLAGLAPAVREALRIGVYQLLYLDRVPAHAAVDESVTIARHASGPGAAGLVNAVLRRIAAERSSLAERIARIRGNAEGGAEADGGRGSAT